MIDSVRATVLAVLNKNNYGYISPSDFNLYAKQAQLDLFEDYFYSYNYQVNKENARKSGTGIADIKKSLAEVIEFFSVSAYLTHIATNTFTVPTTATTGSDYYLINKVLAYTSLLTSGANTSVLASFLVDNTTDFQTAAVQVGDIVVNTTTNQTAIVTSVAPTQLGLDTDIFLAFPENYLVYDDAVVKEIEKVSHSKITMLNNSLLTAPNETFPAYTLEGDVIRVSPNTINTLGQVNCQYFRYPADPKWTYVTLTGGEPAFNSGALDYQDFELPLSDEAYLVAKILEYSGVSIREQTVVQFAKTEEIQNIQEEK